MKRTLSLLLVLSLCFCTLCATAETTTVNKAFEPFAETVTVKVVGSYNVNDATGLKPSNMYWNDFLLEHYNIKLDWLWEVPSDQYEQKLSMSLASGIYPDILNCDFNTFNYLRNANALVDLTDVYEEYACASLKDSYADNLPFEQCTFDGELLAIPYGTEVMTSMDLMYIRTDWLENLGLELPTNIDEFTEMIKAFHDDDPDGNGIDDTYGIALYSALGGQLAMDGIFQMFGAYPTAWIERDGQVVRGAVQDETKVALDYLRGLYEEGYIDPEYATLSFEQAKSRLADGKYGCFVGEWYASDGGLCTDTMKNDPAAMWRVDGLVGPEKGVYAKPTMLSNCVNSYNVVLNTASEEAKIAAIKIMNAWQDRNYPLPVEEGGSGWEWYFNVYEAGTPEYEAYAVRDWDLRWNIPVKTWPTNATKTLYEKSTHDYWTGTTDPYVHAMGVEYHETWNKYAHFNREDMVGDAELDKWYWGQAMKLSRIDSERGRCATAIILDFSQNGNYELDVFYGEETPTGLSAASTLNDYETEYFHRYIMGIEAEDSWEGFVETYNGMGGEAWAEEVNAAYELMK